MALHYKICSDLESSLKIFIALQLSSKKMAEENGNQTPKSEKKFFFKTYKKMSSKERFKLLLKVIVCLICLFGLSFHASILISQFVWGQTVVNVKVEKIKYNKIPAITICYPRFLSMKGLAEANPDLWPDFESYKSIIRNVTHADYSNETLKQKITEIYWEKFMNTNIPFDTPVYDLFENYTIPFRFPKRSLYQFEKFKDYYGVYDDFETEYAIEIEAKGTVRGTGKTKTIVRIRDTNPVESVAMSFRGDQYKCYTFFSELDEKWRKVRLNLNYIAIEVHHNWEWFPPNVYDNINTFPQVMSKYNLG